MTCQHKALIGAAAICFGSWFLYEAYEGAGRKRPFALRFLPGA